MDLLRTQKQPDTDTVVSIITHKALRIMKWLLEMLDQSSLLIVKYSLYCDYLHITSP